MPYQCLTVYNVLFLFIIVMASSSTSSPSEEHTSRTDLNNIPTEEERCIDTSTWSITKCKKLQHMIEFHEEYQCIFREKASLHTIM